MKGYLCGLDKIGQDLWKDVINCSNSKQGTDTEEMFTGFLRD